MTQETDARGALIGKRDAAQASIPRLEKDVAEAAKTMSAGFPSGTPVGDIVKASGVLATASALLEGAQGDVKRANKGLDALVATEKREQVVGVISPITSLFANAAKALPKGCKASGTVPPAMYSKHQAELEAAGVKGVNFTLDATVDGPPIASVKPSGATPRAPSSGKGNGGFSKRLYATPLGDLSQTDVFKSYALEAGVSQERYDAVLADPSNQGISHRGKAVAAKMEFDEVTPA